MFRSLTRRHPARRRGAVLIVVLAMLVLFAVLGLSFVLYSEAQYTAAKHDKEDKNDDTDPNAVAAAQLYMAALVQGPSDESHPLRGHDFASRKYGIDTSGATTQFVLPYAGFAAGKIYNPVTGQSNAAWNLSPGLSGVVNYSRINTAPGGTEWFIYDPMRSTGAPRTHAAPAYANVFFNEADAYTYPDRFNFHLAFQDPTTGEVVLPSFHRPDLFTNANYAAPNDVAQSLNPDNPNWTNQAGRLLTLRPRPAEHPNFPPVPMNTDGTYTGDVCNLKFTSGAQKNDSLWMYAGGPVFKWRGKNYTACVAPLILDLNGRVNLSVAGNRKLNQTLTPTPQNDGATGGSQGLGPWEMDPQQLGLTLADVQSLIARRQGNSANPPADPFTAQMLTARVNNLRLPPVYSMFDPDGDGTRATPALANDSMTLPVAGSFTSFPQYLRGAPVTHQRFVYDAASGLAEVSNHPAQFNPLLYSRGVSGQAGGFGHDDLVRMATRYSDPKGRNVQTASVPTGLASLTPAADTAAARQARAITTTHSVTQQWATGKLNVAGGATVQIGPVDLNRTLPDYRKNPTLPLSPLNVWPVGSVKYNEAHAARHNLARDIFLRLVTNGPANAVVTYNPATGNAEITGNNAAGLDDAMKKAQIAANIVDYIDDDDLVTAFVWNPTATSLTNSPNDLSLDPTNYAAAEIANRVAFGTELPRLVLSEVHSVVDNTRSDPFPGVPARASLPLKRLYWLELHNPTPPEAASSPARSDAGAARLRYATGVTQLPDPVTGTTGAYTGTDFNPYRIEIAEVPTGAGVQQPYSTALGFGTSGLPGKVAADTADATQFPGMALKVRINSFTHDATAPSGPATLIGDAINVVLPTSAASGLNGSNQGYYVIGPRDQFPSGGVTNSMSLPDPPAGVPTPAAPVNALTYDSTAGAPTTMNITDEVAKTSVVILRRLLDPYRPAQENPALLGFNPYITVDYLENVPTRDRATHSTTANGRAESAAATIGRRQPYCAAPAYGSGAAAMVVDQVNAAATPPHTFFALNNPADNVRGTAPNTVGFEWLVHLDRQLISLPEVGQASAMTPAMLTQFFFDGTNYSAHTLYFTGPKTGNLAAVNNTHGLLEVGSRLPGVPLGGREPGRININTVNSPAVVNALFGNTTGNHFPLTNPGQQAAVWNHLSPAAPPGLGVIARTPNRVPRATVTESPSGTDRPFLWGGQNPLANGGNSPIGRFATNPGNNLVGPVFVNGNALHPHLQAEPLRKVWNNVTPVSDTFLVMLTVGFFEVENAGPWDAANPPVLGRELKEKVEGDLRVQFAGVVDRTQLFTHLVGTDAAGVATATATPTASLGTDGVVRGVQSKVVSDAAPGATLLDIEAVPPGGTLPNGTVLGATECAILGDGVVYRINPANTPLLRVGYGDATTGSGDGEWLTVSGVAQRQQLNADGTTYTAVPGQVTLTVSATTRFHGASSPVGNALLGNPGPQSGVTLQQLASRGVVPYFTRLEP